MYRGKKSLSGSVLYCTVRCVLHSSLHSAAWQDKPGRMGQVFHGPVSADMSAHPLAVLIRVRILVPRLRDLRCRTPEPVAYGSTEPRSAARSSEGGHGAHGGTVHQPFVVVPYTPALLVVPYTSALHGGTINLSPSWWYHTPQSFMVVPYTSALHDGTVHLSPSAGLSALRCWSSCAGELVRIISGLVLRCREQVQHDKPPPTN